MRTPWTRRRACSRVGVPPPVRDHVRDAGPMTFGSESTTDEVLDGVDRSGKEGAVRARWGHHHPSVPDHPTRRKGVFGYAMLRAVRLVSARFEELDRRDTPMGEIVLRRRWEPALHVDVYEVKLGDEFLMSSLFTVSEIALATLGLATFPDPARSAHRRPRRRPRPRLHGGRGARRPESGVAQRRRSASAKSSAGTRITCSRSPSALTDGSALPPRRRATSSRWSRPMADLGADAADRWHAILVDIDHTPRHHLHPSHARVLRAGRAPAARPTPAPGWRLRACGRTTHPSRDFVVVMDASSTRASAHVVPFPNPYTGWRVRVHGLRRRCRRLTSVRQPVLSTVPSPYI